MNQYC